MGIFKTWVLNAGEEKFKISSSHYDTAKWSGFNIWPQNIIWTQIVMYVVNSYVVGPIFAM